MFCLTCGYDLSATPTGPCPECGRVFDASQPNTWSTPAAMRARRRVVWMVFLCGAAPMLAPIIIRAEFLIAWLQLGHRPRAYMDDPQYMGGVTTFLHTPGLMFVLLSPMLSLIAIVCGLFVAGLRRRWSYLLLALWPVAAWCLSQGVLSLFPISLTDWWFD